MNGATNSMTNITPVKITTVQGVENIFYYNPTYSRCYKVGNLVIVSFGGCATLSVTGGGGQIGIRGVPKAKDLCYGSLFAYNVGTIGHFRIEPGDNKIWVCVNSANADITSQFVYIADEGGGVS